MHHVGLAPLAGAVSKAGGIGMITALSLPSPQKLREEIHKARDIAGKDKPLGVNLTLLPMLVPPDYDAYVDVVIQEKIPVVETAGHVNGLKKFVDKLKAEGRFIMHKCTAVRHAKSAQKLGVDMISMDGFGTCFITSGSPRTDLNRRVRWAPRGKRHWQLGFARTGQARVGHPVHREWRVRNRYPIGCGHCVGG
jgi:hypothetical protein